MKLDDFAIVPVSMKWRQSYWIDPLDIVMFRSEAGVIEMNGGAESKDGEDEREEETRHYSRLPFKIDYKLNRI